MDPIWNCILTVCCDPLQQNDRRQRAMAKLLMNQGMGASEAKEYAPVVLNALQPLLELLQPFIHAVAGLARGADFKDE